MTKENQSISYQDLYLTVEKKLEKLTSVSLQFERCLRIFATLYAEDVKKDVRSYLLREKLERVEKSVNICGIYFQMLYAQSTNNDPVYPYDEEVL